MEVKPLKYKELPGLSTKQLSEHHDVLYAGYVKKFNEIVEKSKTVDLESTNGSYSELRELFVEKNFTLNGIKLHESYFDNMTDQPSVIDGTIKTLLEKRWGSVEKWQVEFSALGIASRGWVVLAFDYQLGHLENYIYDVHNQGGVADTELVLVMDVYEHAYFLDYATARKDYISAFMACVDWDVVNKRVAHQV
ncbi:superoxide dismutase [Candidatus Saccharibacteria bacterium]|nr:superoxide dismutase [Candidatus Saccharibacteria bacterium]